MSTLRARVIPEQDTGQRIVLAPPAAPALRGAGSIDIICGGCGTLLIQSAQPYLVLHDLVIRCPTCKQCNDTE